MNDQEPFLTDFAITISSLAERKFSDVVYNDCKIAAFLSPNLKKFSFVKQSREEELESVKKLIQGKLDEMENDVQLIEQEPAEQKPKASKPADSDYEVDESDGEENGEIEQYLADRVKIVYTNPLDYWCNSKFTKLRKLAIKTFSRPASSSASERVFNYGKKILKKDRYRLAPSSLSKLTVYSNNRINKTL